MIKVFIMQSCTYYTNKQLTPSLTHVMASASPDPVLKKEGLSLPLDAAANREANLIIFIVDGG